MLDLNAEINWNDAAIRAALNEAVSEGINDACAVLQKQIQRNFASEGGAARKTLYRWNKDPRTGNLRKNRRKQDQRLVFTGAPPGHFPFVRTGNLRRSIQINPANPGRHEAEVGTNLEYGRWLEYGFMAKLWGSGKRVHVAARPWAVRSLNQSKDKMNQAFSRAVMQGLEKRLGR